MVRVLRTSIRNVVQDLVTIKPVALSYSQYTDWALQRCQ